MSARPPGRSDRADTGPSPRSDAGTRPDRSTPETAGRPRRPTKIDLQTAYGQAIPDVVGPDLRVLFCGINPSLWSGWSGHHFARPGNRFWPALHRSGFTPRQLDPSESDAMLELGFGITNLVNRATARADELEPDELLAGGERLVRTVQTWKPRWLAVVGVTAYRAAFRRKDAAIGRQSTDPLFEPTNVWVLPNPSGLNAHYDLPALAVAYGELRDVANNS
ncbi:G/U mismatch-specific DNA glycosylase [Cryptosporangium phraense]|uniref:G/U mismatch-specific DNA glycosylase n=1 Tax=Cryptosporangium phraense TaxID=2593070 RepID=A0A545AKK3_9ACTN|nr:G/U mismatch-specific DNA glycosylase [Cryptosporangium phraense]TQS41838.1 G/U mismatch-specific DNA glycosylase [Cryptosporangium phraense]